jgi:DoxX-like protein
MTAHTVTREPESAQQSSRLTVWGGRVLTALPILIMLASALMKLNPNPQMLEQFVGRFGYAESSLLTIAVLELACVALYAIPQTAVLGAVLMTGYLGGAIATHVRVGDPGYVVPLLLGVSAWAGLFLRDERLRTLLPIRKKRL